MFWFCGKSWQKKKRHKRGRGTMKYEYCPNCQKHMGFKRALGWGTFFTALVTGGLWLLAIPFYPVRCMGCGFDEGGLTEEKSNPDKWLSSTAEKMKKARAHHE
jgi:hypothetical protein